MESGISLVNLSMADLSEIMRLERAVCAPHIQADKSTILERLNLGNIMLGVQYNNRLVGSIGFRYSVFSPDNLESFPKTFGEFSTPVRTPQKWNAAFIYSVNVDPELRFMAKHKERSKGLRALGIGRKLFEGMLAHAKHNNCEWLAGDGRPAFYNGSDCYPFEKYEIVPELKEIIDNCGGENRRPTIDEERKLLNYPILRFYNKVLGRDIRIAWILSDFFPKDIPSGGFRIILCKAI